MAALNEIDIYIICFSLMDIDSFIPKFCIVRNTNLTAYLRNLKVVILNVVLRAKISILR